MSPRCWSGARRAIGGRRCAAVEAARGHSWGVDYGRSVPCACFACAVGCSDQLDELLELADSGEGGLALWLRYADPAAVLARWHSWSSAHRWHWHQEIEDAWLEPGEAPSVVWCEEHAAARRGQR